MEEQLEIARLKGQVEAYQDRERSAAIELIRVQMDKLREANSRLETALLASQSALGRTQAELARVAERQDKIAEFVRTNVKPVPDVDNKEEAAE